MGFRKRFGDGQFHGTADLYSDHSENLLYMVDRDDHRLQVFIDQSSHLKFKWGSDGKGDGPFHVPYAALMKTLAGNVWVADRNNDRIQKFDKDGNFLLKFGSPRGKDKVDLIYPDESLSIEIFSSCMW